MRVKALLALLGVGLALVLMVGCSDSNNEVTNTGTVTGTITNALTGLPQSAATVTLFQNGVVVPGQTVITGDDGVYTFTNVATGANYTIQVSSATNAFTTVTSNAITVTTGTNTIDLAVGNGTVTGTITNASTGLPQSAATVTLFQNGVEVPGQTMITGNDGVYTLTNVATGANYTIQVSSATNAFTTVTSNAFTVTAGTNNVDLTVGTGLVGSTVSGVVGTIDPNATFTVDALQNGTVVATTTTGVTVPPANGPTFTLTNVPTNTATILRVTSASYPDVVTLFGPITVPTAGMANLSILTKTPDQLSNDTAGAIGTVPPANGTATVVAYITGAGTVQVGTQTSGVGNPAFLSGLTPQTADLLVTPTGGAAVDFGNVVLAANTVYVIRMTQ